MFLGKKHITETYDTRPSKLDGEMLLSSSGIWAKQLNFLKRKLGNV